MTYLEELGTVIQCHSEERRLLGLKLGGMLTLGVLPPPVGPPSGVTSMGSMGVEEITWRGGAG